MPGFDGTGPNGKGSMTGDCRGYCIVPLDTPKQDLVSLKKQAQNIKEQLEQIETSISKIENANTAKK